MKRSGRSAPRLRSMAAAWTLICLVSLVPGAASLPAAEASTSEPAGARAETMLAGLSDEQVRQMLLDELNKDAADAETGSDTIKGPAAVLARMLDSLNRAHDRNENQVKALLGFIPAAGGDLYRVFVTLCPYGTPRGALLNIFLVACFLGIGLAVEYLFRRLFLGRYLPPEAAMEFAELGGFGRFLSALVALLPELVGLLIFFGIAYFSYTSLIWTDSASVRLFFFATLIAVTSIRVVNRAAVTLFSPANGQLRFIPMQSDTARRGYRITLWVSGYIIAALMLAVVMKHLGAQPETVRLVQLAMATLLLVATGSAAAVYRRQGRDHLLAAGRADGQSLTWGRRQFAEIWHVLAIVYVIVLWFLLLENLADPAAKGGGAFILSFFVVPIWMIADRVIRWVVAYAMSTLLIHQQSYDDENEPSEEELAGREQGRLLFRRVEAVARIAVVGALIIWVASLWQIRIPFFSEFAAFLLDSIIILTVALVFWQFISSWIERKIRETVPEAEDEDDPADDEWGGAASRGRAYTLLPMLRKFIGGVLLIMVTMILLSSLGVDIGPLLAGAGVVGLAIGFGAQKLVADIFSGFFYLLDDAFRVGEYITAGTVSGTVENITLRNVMLRHHRGMLQIIPHSELGAITNFMRGGIVVKFNLDFPYDAPIDKIRKIIKKVGQKMLDNEEYGKDFIRPLKSQGVREITNSVMTIRVKFTAQPGTHFVIRREAYRLITEALNEQGIYYAHRKVIVDIPELDEDHRDRLDEEKKKQIGHAAGAAAMREIEEEAKDAADPPAGSGSLPGD